MEKIIVANLKMYMDQEEVLSYIKALDSIPHINQVLFFPSTLYLPYFTEKKYPVGIQNISTEKQGAYTGEVSAKQAASLGVQACLIGHSERRKYFKEDNVQIGEKLRRAEENGLQIILCIGETIEEQEEEKTESILAEQLSVLERVSTSYFSNLMIAYEPVWAVGTGHLPTHTVLKERISFIRKYLERWPESDTIPILYGGSITPDTIGNLCTIEEVNGFLIGKASTDIEKLSQMIEVAVTM